MNYRRLAEINSGYYGLSQMRTLARGPYSVRNKGSELYGEDAKIQYCNSTRSYHKLVVRFFGATLCGKQLTSLE